MIKPITQFFKLLYQAPSGRDYDTGKKRETAEEHLRDARITSRINIVIIWVAVLVTILNVTMFILRRVGY